MVLGEGAGSRAGEWYAAGLLLLYALLVVAHSGAPGLTDYPNWTYQGVLLREHLLGHGDPAHALKMYPVPNSLTTVGIGLLALLLPWVAAAKGWLLIQLAFCFASMRLLLRTLHAPAVAWVVLPQAVFLNVNFWYGFMNFELGLAWVMLFTAMLLRGARGRLLSLILVMAFFTHMIPFCFCVLLLLLRAWQTRWWGQLWSAAPALLLTLWYVLGRYLLAGNADGKAGMHETVRSYSAAFVLFKINSYAKSFGFSNPLGDDQRVFGRAGFALMLLAEGTLALVAGWALTREFVHAIRHKERMRFALIGIALMLPVFVFAPGTALGISDPGARVLQTALALGLAVAWSRVGQTARVIAGVSAGILAAGGLVLFSIYGGERGSTPRQSPGSDSRSAQFAHVPIDDQDGYYAALRRGRYDMAVFPTGIFLNR